MTEKHYAHLAPSYVADTIRAFPDARHWRRHYRSSDQAREAVKFRLARGQAAPTLPTRVLWMRYR
jgi:hypothetical protein